VFVPVGAMLLGAALVLLGHRMPGLITMYFGAQPGFNLYMKAVLSDAEISSAHGMRGVPAAFLVTTLQLLVAFLFMISAVAALWFTPWRYRIKSLKTQREWIAVLCFSAAFAANIGLNNLSLSYLPMSLNLTIRSCLPLVTLALQLLISRCQLGDTPPASCKEVGIMSFGVFCACLATMAKGEGSDSAKEWNRLYFGVAACCLSCAAAALNLVLVAAVGQKMKLNPVDSALYMALPAAFCLLPPAILVPHPVEWPGFKSLTDVQILGQVLELSPGTVAWLALSGVFGMAYNVLQFHLVQTFSAAHTAFAGNFNKAATIMLSICFGLESLPRKPWDHVMLIAVTGKVCAFACYSANRGAGRRRRSEHPGDGQEGDVDDSAAATRRRSILAAAKTSILAAAGKANILLKPSARKADSAPKRLDGVPQPTVTAGA
jgi:drug/metabolite transporter (DMT)-like permease